MKKEEKVAIGMKALFPDWVGHTKEAIVRTKDGMYKICLGADVIVKGWKWKKIS